MRGCVAQVVLRGDARVVLDQLLGCLRVPPGAEPGQWREWAGGLSAKAQVGAPARAARWAG